jgi:hypothetical protein
MLVPELRMLAISPVFSPKIKRQIKRIRSQMVSFGMAASRIVCNIFSAVEVLLIPSLSPVKNTRIAPGNGKKEKRRLY